MRTAEKKNH